MRIVEYVVQDCPITGRVVQRHYIDDGKIVKGRKGKKYGKR